MDTQTSVLEVQEQADRMIARLKCDLTVPYASRLHEQLLDLTRHCEALSVDLGQAGELDVAGVQLLIATFRAMQSKDKQVDFVNIDNTLMDTLNLLQLGTMLSLSAKNG